MGLIRKPNKGSKPRSDRLRMRDKLDRLSSSVVRLEGVCLACGYPTNGKVYQCSERMECAHIKSRGWSAIRHHPKNLTCLCNIHHRYFTQHPDEWDKFIESKYPGRLDWLLELRSDPETEPQEYWLGYWTRKLKDANSD